MLAKYFSIIRNYALSVLSQRKYTFYHQSMLLDAFRPNSRNMTGRNPSMVIPLLANQDLTPMLVRCISTEQLTGSRTIGQLLLLQKSHRQKIFRRETSDSPKEFSEVTSLIFTSSCISLFS